MSKDHDDNEMPHVEMPIFESPPKDYAEFTQQANAMAQKGLSEAMKLV